MEGKKQWQVSHLKILRLFCLTLFYHFTLSDATESFPTKNQDRNNATFVPPTIPNVYHSNKMRSVYTLCSLFSFSKFNESMAEAKFFQAPQFFKRLKTSSKFIYEQLDLNYELPDEILKEIIFRFSSPNDLSDSQRGKALLELMKIRWHERMYKKADIRKYLSHSKNILKLTKNKRSRNDTRYTTKGKQITKQKILSKPRSVNHFHRYEPNSYQRQSTKKCKKRDRRRLENKIKNKQFGDGQFSISKISSLSKLPSDDLEFITLQELSRLCSRINHGETADKTHTPIPRIPLSMESETELKMSSSIAPRLPGRIKRELSSRQTDGGRTYTKKSKENKGKRRKRRKMKGVQKELISKKKTKRSLSEIARSETPLVGGGRRKGILASSGQWMEESVMSGWTNEGEWETGETSWGHEGAFGETSEVIWEKEDKSKWAERDSNVAALDHSEGNSLCRCWNTTDYSGGELEVECQCHKWTSPDKNPPRLVPGVQRVTISDRTLKILGNNSFQFCSSTLQDIVLMEVSGLETIQSGTLEDLKRLQSFSIFNAHHLKYISNLSFTRGLPSLRSVRILKSGLTEVPKLIADDRSEIFTLIDLENNKIEILRSRSIRVRVEQLVLNYNMIHTIEEETFYESKIGKLSLKGNEFLQNLHPRSFASIRSLRSIDLSGTSITFLPTEGMEDIEELWLQNVPTLKVFPSVYAFKSIRTAHLTYPYHCCAFQFPQQHNPEVHKQHMEDMKKRQEMESCVQEESSTHSPLVSSIDNHDNQATPESETPISYSFGDIEIKDKPVAKRSIEERHYQKELVSVSLKEADHLRMKQRHSGFKTRLKTDRFLPNRLNFIHHDEFFGAEPQSSNSKGETGTPSLSSSGAMGIPFFSGEGIFIDNFGGFNESSFLPGFSGNEGTTTTKYEKEDKKGDSKWTAFHPSLNPRHGSYVDGTFHPNPAEVHNRTMIIFCGNLSKNYRDVQCYPPADALNPCEDIMGRVALRIMVWFVIILAVLGNMAVMVVLLSSKFRMTVSKFLMVNLATADLCMGIYLLLIGVMDLHTQGVYFNFAIDWQNGVGCKVAGFLTVFSSELSIFTLTIITTERWYAITYAINLNKRLKLSVAVKVMCLGWIYSLFMATLPLVGVSGYSKTSICLPMEAGDGLSIAYLVTLLVLNGLAFLVISACYASMYCSISTHDVVTTHSDLKVAKRMALLVFTDFACWAPIAFFGLTAVAGVPFISVSNSKILLVTFYPLNSCANPYLYAILTRQYRRDLYTLLERHGLCTQRIARSTLMTPRSLDMRYKGTYSSINNTNLHHHMATPAHRGSLQTQTTVCDFRSAVRPSFQSQQGPMVGQSHLSASQDAGTSHVTPRRISVKRGPSYFGDSEKQLTTVKEMSHSSDAENHDHYSTEEGNTKLLPEITKREHSRPENLVLKPQTGKLQVLSEEPQVKIVSENQIKFSKYPEESNGSKNGDSSEVRVEGYENVRVIENDATTEENIKDTIENDHEEKEEEEEEEVEEEEVDITNNDESQYDTKNDESKSEEENENEDNDEEEEEEESDDDFDNDRKVILEVGSPHPIKNCHTSLVVSQEQLAILDKALKNSKKAMREGRAFDEED